MLQQSRSASALPRWPVTHQNATWILTRGPRCLFVDEMGRPFPQAGPLTSILNMNLIGRTAQYQFAVDYERENTRDGQGGEKASKQNRKGASATRKQSVTMVVADITPHTIPFATEDQGLPQHAEVLARLGAFVAFLGGRQKREEK